MPVNVWSQEHKIVSNDTSRIEKNTIKSPRNAMVRSLLFPGLGQYYNGKKFKSLVIFCTELGLLTNSIYLNQKYQSTLRDDYDDEKYYEAAKEFYIDNRSLSTWCLAGSILFSVLDAYVDAHLDSFDESPDLSFNLNAKKELLLTMSISF